LSAAESLLPLFRAKLTHAFPDSDEEDEAQKVGDAVPDQAEEQSIRRLLLILSILDEAHVHQSREIAANLDTKSRSGLQQDSQSRLSQQLNRLTRLGLGANPGKELSVEDVDQADDPDYVPPHLSRSVESTALVMKSMIHIVLLSQDFLDGHYWKKMQPGSSTLTLYSKYSR
jgi:hypothetical protein